MLTSDKPYTLDRVVRLVLSAAAIVLAVWLLGYLSSALVPFVAALLLAYLLDPVTSFIERVVGNRGVAVFLSVAGLLALIVILFLTVVPMMADEFAHMGRVIKDLATDQGLAQRVRGYLPPDLWNWVRDFVRSQDIQSLFTSDGAMKVVQSLFDKAMPGIRGLLQGTANALAGVLGLAVILLYLVFMLADFGRIRSNWQNWLPKEYRQTVVEFAAEFEETMSRYFRGQVIIALLVGVLLSIGFLIIGLPLALVLGMLTGILNIAPYLGTLGVIIAMPLAALSSLEAGQTPWVGMGLALLVFAVVQAIQEVVLIPRIQGKSMGLSPWLILLALSVWGKLLGFLGLLIALPMTCLCLSYYRRLLARREAE
ncbi:AI-2E family transporter [Pseudodesulfovibrio cashew]|uniref:AI-2E family transporter n=1 Tax=Pseudodesulfovibrio cashew TaxID=2678688 RepID=A0A6I6JGW4_9BACT|nr:AI-2E family transporter [Pseudodesulfovibrio cashew]QGY39753.1 AI-2E family transporter [Pseudodesulfovibrio cashew]